MDCGFFIMLFLFVQSGLPDKKANITERSYFET